MLAVFKVQEPNYNLHVHVRIRWSRIFFFISIEFFLLDITQINVLYKINEDVAAFQDFKFKFTNFGVLKMLNIPENHLANTKKLAGDQPWHSSMYTCFSNDICYKTKQNIMTNFYVHN